jgi:hypothetical protein
VDEEGMMAHAEAHAAAMAAGDLNRAGRDLDTAARAGAADVMKRVPRSIDRADVTSARREGDELVVCTRYAGGDSEATVEARWAERDGRPRIVALRVV